MFMVQDSGAETPSCLYTASRVNELIGNASITLTPLMVEAFGGYTLDNCTDKCLTYSLGSLFGTTPGDRQVRAGL